MSPYCHEVRGYDWRLQMPGRHSDLIQKGSRVSTCLKHRDIYPLRTDCKELSSRLSSLDNGYIYDEELKDVVLAAPQ